MDFDEADLLDTVRQIEKRWEEGETSALLLKELLTAFRHHEARVQDQLTDVTERQHGLEKALILLATHAEHSDKRHRALVKSLGKAITGGLSKGRQLPAAADARRPQPGLSLVDEAKRGQLAKSIVAVFGPNGGHSLRYDGALASRLLMDGRMDKKEHHLWKRSGRVSDAVWSRMQQRAG